MITRFVAVGAATVVGFSGTALPANAYNATQVRHAQTQLNVLGCGAGPVNGSVGIMTKAAIVRFQAVMRIRQTGTLNAPTYWRLGKSWRKPCNRRAVPASAGGRRIVISQSQNYLWVINGAGRVVRQEGMIDNPKYLRPGTYYTGSKCGRAARVRTNHAGRLILHNFVRFAPCGVGFHQIPYPSGGAQIHPTYLLGTNYRASHGCIRVSKAMSDTIWSFTTIRTRVVVVR